MTTNVSISLTHHYLSSMDARRGDGGLFRKSSKLKRKILPLSLEKACEKAWGKCLLALVMRTIYLPYPHLNIHIESPFVSSPSFLSHSRMSLWTSKQKIATRTYTYIDLSLPTFIYTYIQNRKRDKKNACSRQVLIVVLLGRSPPSREPPSGSCLW